jgi:hypothetical protein
MSSNLFMNFSLGKTMSKTSVTGIFNSISEKKSLALFNSIAIQRKDSKDLKTELQLTPKQYYSRMYVLMKAGLVKRERGKYCLTCLGKVTYNSYTSIQYAVDNYWKLKAIDSFEMSSDHISKDERVNMINALIGNDDKIKAILFSIS